MSTRYTAFLTTRYRARTFATPFLRDAAAGVAPPAAAFLALRVGACHTDTTGKCQCCIDLLRERDAAEADHCGSPIELGDERRSSCGCECPARICRRVSCSVKDGANPMYRAICARRAPANESKCRNLIRQPARALFGFVSFALQTWLMTWHLPTQ